MEYPPSTLEQRVLQYASAAGKQFKASLGYGNDGDVFVTFEDSAVKFFNRSEDFDRELACYQRLAELGVKKVLGHAVPELIHWDESLLAIEMSIVTRPFLLDFASAYLDWAPDFSPEVLEEWSQRKAKEFGRHWSVVQLILAYLGEKYGIYLTDIHRGNIAFDDDDPTATASTS